MQNKVIRRTAIAAAALLLVWSVPSAAAQTNGEKLELTAFAINMGDLGPSGAQSVDIVVNSWTMDAERDRLADALRKGPDELLDALQDSREVGYIKTPDSIGYPLRYARQIPGEDGGKRIILATDRPIGFWEASRRPRTIDYPFTVIEVRLDPDGRGEGKMSVATKITLNKDNVVELENYGTQPVQLQSVRAKTR